MKRTAILIDGGYARSLTNSRGVIYNPDYIEKIAHACRAAQDDLLRILYYDCRPFKGTVDRPVSGKKHNFQGNPGWLYELSRKDQFAVRLGILKFRGWRPRNIPLASGSLSDNDFDPVFEQKGVDMRIGLDIASYSDARAVERIVLVSGDTDCIPAMKHARKAGLEVVMVQFEEIASLAPELLSHCDFTRAVSWPEP
ncbi:MAG: NYN domain-containing protein [Rhodospirillaceae bacterium]|nr:NYN domain-containing protein [Rhodospirillaceae bacterium]|tara:strand:+ start:539 stop:1129 length:591 start_codon:yes stop_codon:yes gene_type:complete